MAFCLHNPSLASHSEACISLCHLCPPDITQFSPNIRQTFLPTSQCTTTPHARQPHLSSLRLPSANTRSIAHKMNTLRTSTTRAVRSLTAAAPLRGASAVTARQNSTAQTYKSPFEAAGEPHATTKIPDFSKYRGGSTKGNQVFGYFMVGTMGALTAAGAKATIQGRLPRYMRGMGKRSAGLIVRAQTSWST